MPGNRPRAPLRSTGRPPDINLHQNSTPETNSNALSWWAGGGCFGTHPYDFLTDRTSSILGGLGGPGRPGYHPKRWGPKPQHLFKNPGCSQERVCPEGRVSAGFRPTPAPKTFQIDSGPVSANKNAPFWKVLVFPGGRRLQAPRLLPGELPSPDHPLGWGAAAPHHPPVC